MRRAAAERLRESRNRLPRVISDDSHPSASDQLAYTVAHAGPLLGGGPALPHLPHLFPGCGFILHGIAAAPAAGADAAVSHSHQPIPKQVGARLDGQVTMDRHGFLYPPR